MRALEQAVRIRSFLVATVAIFAVVVVLFSNRQVRAGNWVLCLEPILLLVWSGASRIYRRQLIARFGTFREEPIAEPRPLPDRYAIVADGLGSLGFTQLGQVRLRFAWQPWQEAWISRSRDAETTALVLGAPGVTFATSWPDGSLLTTTNRPPRATIRLPEAWAQGVRGEVARVYQRHLEARAEFGQGRPAPLSIKTLDDVIASERRTLLTSRDAIAAMTRRPWTRRTEVALSVLAIALLIAQVVSALTS